MQRTRASDRHRAQAGAIKTPAATRKKVVVLGTGGTIAGTAASPDDDLGYRSAQVDVADLLAGLAPAGVTLEAEQVAQLDSKDMDFTVWRGLAERVDRHLGRAEVAGIVITHGTDTLEETAYFLQRVLAPAKPVVLTGAMRPATSAQADGPRNLRDALAVAAADGVSGVLAVIAGHVHGGDDVRKVHPQRLDAFSSGDAGPVARIEAGTLRRLRDWPRGSALGLDVLPLDPARWPYVEIVTSVSGPHAATVAALCAAGVRGIVVATTGNGTIHHALEQALREAEAGGVAILRSTRCLDGRIAEPDPPDGADARRLASAGALTPVQARVELMLQLGVAASGRPPDGVTA